MNLLTVADPKTKGREDKQIWEEGAILSRITIVDPETYCLGGGRIGEEEAILRRMTIVGPDNQDRGDYEIRQPRKAKEPKTIKAKCVKDENFSE